MWAMPDFDDSVDISRPNPARMYDYYLGGAHNFAVDREAADRVLAILPETREFAMRNREFLQRVVRFLAAEAGITQFLDLGSGIPTVGNVHEVAQAVHPATVSSTSTTSPSPSPSRSASWPTNPYAAVVHADVRDHRAVLNHPDTLRLLDFSQPLAVLMLQVLPFIPDADDPAQVVATYRDACVSGSYLALAHSLSFDYWPGAVAEAVDMYTKSTHPLNLRTPDQVAAFFGGYALIDPGVVFTAVWRPEKAVTDEEAIGSRAVAGLGLLS